MLILGRDVVLLDKLYVIPANDLSWSDLHRGPHLLLSASLLRCLTELDLGLEIHFSRGRCVLKLKFIDSVREPDCWERWLRL